MLDLLFPQTSIFALIDGILLVVSGSMLKGVQDRPDQLYSTGYEASPVTGRWDSNFEERARECGRIFVGVGVLLVACGVANVALVTLSNYDKTPEPEVLTISTVESASTEMLPKSEVDSK